MRHYRGLFLLAALLLVMVTLCLQPGEASNTECACKTAGGDQGREEAVQQEQSKVPLDATRAAALRQLYEEMKAGTPVIRQEAEVLMRHIAGEYISALEADAVISRVLYDFYGSGLPLSRLTAEQESLLIRYKEAFAHQPQSIDFRTELLSGNDLGLSLDKSGTFSIDAVLPLAPTGDTCAVATPLTLNIPVAGNTTGFPANDYQLALPSTCFAGTGNTGTTATGRDVVYSFTAPFTGQYSFRAWQYVSTGTSNAVVYLSSTCPAATPGTPVDVTCLAASNFQSSTGGEEINCFSLAAGQQVFFFIDEATLGAGGTFYALVEQCGPMETEPNNTPATATPLTCGIQGQVNPATEADFYSIGTPAAGSRLFAMVDASTAGPSADVDLRVNTATDTVEFDDLDSDVEFGVSGFAPIISGTIATGAPLFYQVDRFGAAPTGNAFPYRLYSVVQPAIANATAESEPNDTTATASFAANNYFSGALAGPAPSTDADLYSFPATAGDLIMVIVDGDPLRNNTPVDTRLELLDSAGATLVDVDGSGSTVNLDNANPPGLFETVPTFPSEGLLFRAPTTGVYFARVSTAVTGATGVGDYLLSITRNCTTGGGVSPPPTFENDTCAGAIPLTLNIPVAGGTTGVTNNDYQLSGSACFTGTGNTSTSATGRDVVYSFTAPSAGQYSFRAWQYTSTGTSNAVVYLADSCPAATPGTPVTVSCSAASNFQSSTGGEELNCVPLTAGQQVFFFIDEATFGAGGSFYALVEQCGPMETESNNTPATASPLSCGIQGAVNPATEADFFSIGTPAAGSRLFAMVDASTAGPSADVDLRVNTATDTVEYDDLDSDIEFGVSGFAPSVTGTIATGAALFYQVDRFGAAPTGNASPYRLYSVVQPPSASATAETEPNDTPATATIAVNNYFSGALAGPAPSTDVDLYGFQAQAGDRIMLNVDGDPLRNNTPVDTQLELLDSAGTPLVNVNGSGSTVNLDNANPAGLFETVPNFPSESLVFRAPTTGVFYARVSPAVTGATGVGDYLLSISKNCTIGGGGICTVNAPADITVTNDPNQCGAVVNYPAPTTSGNCGTVTCSPASGSFFPRGTTSVTCMASTTGASDTFLITVNDIQPPTIVCSSNIVIGTDPGVNSAIVTYPPPTSSDNCPGVLASYSIPSGSTFPLGTTTVAGTATDNAGNTATCSFTVTVLQRNLSIADATITEGDSGATNLVFTVTLSPSSTPTVMVDFFTSNGTATTPSDYQSVSGTLTFAPGQLTRTITVPINGDTLPEGHETFFVNLTNPTNAIISDAQSIGTITDDDATSMFQFSASTASVSENAGSVTLTITRTGDTSGAASLKFETSDLTAKQKSDYTFGSGTVQFDPGNTSKTFQVLLVNDAFVEGSEMFMVDLSNPSGSNAVGSPSTAFVTITDDDSVPTTANPIDQAQFFVRQQYLDFLARETDPAGLSFWTNEIISCGSDADCISAKRVNVSAAFFLSIEFQETSGNVIRTQRVAFGRQSIDAASRVPFLQFMRDTRQVGAGVIVGQPGFEALLDQNKQAYAQQIVASAEFLARFPITPAGPYVDALFASAVVTPTADERQAAINAFGAGGAAGRVAALRSVSDSDSLRQVEFRPSFVLVQYYGYLRRSPTDLPDVDDSGYQFWLAKLNAFNGDFVAAEMVKSFLVSGEYRGRFGP